MPKKRCRSGCITCRIRKIKCDEEKPSCLRCTSTGRKCDGYEGEIARARSPTIRPHPLALRSMISQGPGPLVVNYELRALQHFRTRTAPALSASFDCDFWNTIVLQLSATQDPVRTAVVALSCLHESFEKTHGNIETVRHVDSSQVLALQQYNKAISQTAQILNFQDATSCGVAMISCLLFICLELIQDNYTISIDHLVSGLRMLRYCQNAALGVSSQPSLSLLHDNLNQFFGRLVVQTMFMADTHFDVRVIPKHSEEKERTSLASVTEARDTLDAIFLSVYPFLHLIKREPNHGMGKSYQQTLSNRLERWYQLLRKFEAESREKLTSKDITGIQLLEIHYTCLSVMIDTSLDASQCFLEPPASSFLHIVNVIETLLEQQSKSIRSDSRPPSGLPYYSFDLGVIGPLFYTAVKCWNPELRQKVISLLQHPAIPHREGIWKSSMTLSMAQRIIKLQEQIVRSAAVSTKSLEADEVNDHGKLHPETLKKNLRFDFVRPKKDEKQLKILVGIQGETQKESKQEVITW